MLVLGLKCLWMVFLVFWILVLLLRNISMLFGVLCLSLVSVLTILLIGFFFFIFFFWSFGGLFILVFFGGWDFREFFGEGGENFGEGERGW